jgi:hypothetical protein
MVVNEPHEESKMWTRTTATPRTDELIVNNEQRVIDYSPFRSAPRTGRDGTLSGLSVFSLVCAIAINPVVLWALFPSAFSAELAPSERSQFSLAFAFGPIAFDIILASAALARGLYWRRRGNALAGTAFALSAIWCILDLLVWWLLVWRPFGNTG